MKNNENKTNKKISILYYTASLCYYIFAILNFVKEDNNSTAVMYLCLGSTFLCLGSVYLNKSKDKNNNNDKK